MTVDSLKAQCRSLSKNSRTPASWTLTENNDGQPPFEITTYEGYGMQLTLFVTPNTSGLAKLVVSPSNATSTFQELGAGGCTKLILKPVGQN
jgi:hypothetical protein